MDINWPWEEVAERYVEGIHDKLHHYYAAWMPNEKLNLGDVMWQRFTQGG